MRVYYDIDDLPVFGRAVATVGSFDGVHAGHREIISHLTKSALRKNEQSIVITFSPHPRQILENNSSLKLLNTLDEKLYLLERTGVDNVIVVPFTEEFSRTSWDHFVSRFLIERIGIGTLVVGYNHHFGKAKEGNYEHLNRNPLKFGIELECVSRKEVNGAKVSSSVIRELIGGGHMEVASEYLTYSYFVTGEVVPFAGNPDQHKLLSVGNKFKLIPAAGRYNGIVSRWEDNLMISECGITVDNRGLISFNALDMADGMKVMVSFI